MHRNEKKTVENNDNLNLAHVCAKLPNEEIWNTLVQKTQVFPFEAFLSIGFSHHRLILSKIKNEEERIFYIKRCAAERFSYEALGRSIASDDYQHQGSLPNNFYETLPAIEQAFRAANTFIYWLILVAFIMSILQNIDLIVKGGDRL